jgi:hypothetical protein
MVYKQFDKDFQEQPVDVRIYIPNQVFTIEKPKPTLLAQGAKMFWEYTRWWQKIIVIFFLSLMLVLPFLTNWMNVQMVQGNMQSFAIIFCIIRILENIIVIIRDCFLLSIASKMD